MSKKITIELTDQEYESLAKAFAQAKDNKLMPTKALNIDDFCKEVIVGMATSPFNNLKPEEVLSKLGDLKDMLGGMGGDLNLDDLLGGNKPTKKEEPKKDEVPDDQKYKS